MIGYVEQFLGLDPGQLNTPLGIALCLVILVVSGVSIFRVVIVWLGTFFGGRR